MRPGKSWEAATSPNGIRESAQHGCAPRRCSLDIVVAILKREVAPYEYDLLCAPHLNVENQ